jgi:hypothetical protein
VVNRAAGVPWTYGTDLGVCGTRVGGGGPYHPGPGIQCLDPNAPVAGQRTARSDLPSQAEPSGSPATWPPGPGST